MAVFVEPQPELLHYGIFRLAVLAIYCFDAEYALQLYSFGCGDYGEIASVGEFPALRVLNLDSCSAVWALHYDSFLHELWSSLLRELLATLAASIVEA